MGIMNNLLELIFKTSTFKDTIFFKENSDLQERYNALIKLKSEYTDNQSLNEELYIIKRGLDGENEIYYQLKKSHIGMYVLRDIKLKYKELTAQIDYVIITPIFTYYIECKNLIGNITVNEKGDFIRELNINGKKIKKGMYSPLRQVEAQREVARKIWEEDKKGIIKILGLKNFEYYRKVLVVAANHETIINISKAPKEIKNKVLRADNLVRQIEYDLKNVSKDEMIDTQKTMEKQAQYYLELSCKDEIDYYEYYKNKYNLNINNNVNKNEIKDNLITFRKEKSKEMNVPAYFIFNNSELEKIIEKMPKTIKELKESKILSDIKLNIHGKSIIDIINNKK